MKSISLALFLTLTYVTFQGVLCVDNSININFASILAGVSSPANSSTGTCPNIAPVVPLPKWLSFLIPLLNISGPCFGQSQTQCNSSPNCWFYFGVCLEGGVVPYPQHPTPPTSAPSAGPTVTPPAGPTTTAAPTAAPATRAETTVAPVIALNTTRGKEIGSVYQSWLSPQQEGGEEEDTPASTPSQFKSTKPSTPRNQRQSRGHGVLQFTKDFSKAYAYLKLENIDTNEINLLHIHCGRPGQLGPIIVDFSTIGNITEAFKDGVLAFEVTNEDIATVVNSGTGLLGLATAGCPIIQQIPTDKVKTIAGMELIARSGELYWNVHTYAQTYYGDVRGQLVQVTAGNN